MDLICPVVDGLNESGRCMQLLYEDDNEYQKHSSAIHKLAEQFQQKESYVRDIYEETLSQLLPRARFKRYLSILVSRQVSEFLRARHN